MKIEELLRESAPFAIKTLWVCLLVGPTMWVLGGSLLPVAEIGSSELASWVQAIGSIAAILIAIWVASSQRRAQLQDGKARSQLLERHVRSLAERSKRAVTIQSRERINLKSSLNLISGLRHSFDSINLLDLPSVSLLEPVSTLRDALRGLEGGMLEAESDNILSVWMDTPTAALWMSLATVSANQVLEEGRQGR